MRRFRSIYVKNLMIVALALALSFILLISAFAMISYSYIIREKTHDMEAYAKTSVNIISSYSGHFEADSLEMRGLLVLIAETGDYHVIVTDEVGNVISCSDRELECEHIGKTVPASFIASVNNTGAYSGLSKLGGLYSEGRYVVGLNLKRDEYPSSYAGFIFFSAGARDISRIWRYSATVCGIIALVVFSVAFVACYFATKKQAKPINEMAAAAHKFGRGDLSVRVDENGRTDEIGELSHAFNKMVESLERSEMVRRDLIANVSHELKTPMTTITGFADGILDGTIPPEREREYLQIISSETKRLNRLVRGMLDMSQLRNMDEAEVKKKSFDIAEVIRLALVSLEPKITGRGLDVDVSLPEEPIITLGDSDSITQVVYNLIDNAAKFAREGSSIGIELWKESGKAKVSVSNEGETIPREELPLIFDRFHKSDRSRSVDKEGVGLGLYIVKTILDSHGEDVFVTSREGLTTFTFTLTVIE